MDATEPKPTVAPAGRAEGHLVPKDPGPPTDPWAAPVRTAPAAPTDDAGADHEGAETAVRLGGAELAEPITAPLPAVRSGHGGAVPMAPPTVGAVPMAPPTGWVVPMAAPTGAAVPMAPPKPGWTLTDVFVGFGVTLLLTLLVGAVARMSSFDGGPALLVLGGLPIWISLLGTTIWACRRHGVGNLVVDLGLRVRWSDVGIGLAVGVGLRLAVGAWATIVARSTQQIPESNVPELGGGGLGSGPWLVVNVLAIALVGPVIEEIFFRGLVLRSALGTLLRRSDRPRLAAPERRLRYAALISAALFSALHLGEVPNVTSALVLLPGLFFAGWVMARLTLWRQRLGPAVVTHVVFNGTAVVALLAIG